MPRNGSGSYSLPSGNPVVTNTIIRSSWANTTMTDVAVALTNSLSKDGQTTPIGDLPMGGFRHTGVGLATALTQYARVSQVQDGSLLRCTNEAGGDAYTGLLPFGQTVFRNGQLISFKFPAVNTTATPTLNINSSAAWIILRQDGSSVLPGDCRINLPSYLVFNDTSWLLLGSIGAGGGTGVASVNGHTGVVTLSSVDITSSLGYTPLNIAGGTMTGMLTLAGNATQALHPVTLQQMNAAIQPAVAGVSSFQGSGAPRTGAIVLSSADVVTALGYAPVQSVNGATGVVTITAASIGAQPALGYTPQPALGYTPVNKAGDTMVGTLGGLTASFKKYAKNALVQAPSANLDFTNNDTLIITYGTAYTISGVTGLNDGDEGVVLFNQTSTGDITWAGSLFKWDRDSDPGTPYSEPPFGTGPMNFAIVRVRRISSWYFVSARVF